MPHHLVWKWHSVALLFCLIILLFQLIFLFRMSLFGFELSFVATRLPASFKALFLVCPPTMLVMLHLVWCYLFFILYDDLSIFFTQGCAKAIANKHGKRSLNICPQKIIVQWPPWTLVRCITTVCQCVAYPNTLDFVLDNPSRFFSLIYLFCDINTLEAWPKCWANPPVP